LPGKYKVLGERLAVGATCDRLGHRAGEEYIEPGQIVDILEVKEVEEDEHVRGKMADGKWISIASISGDTQWARRISLVSQLMELGFSQEQACAAAKRCSTVEASVEFLDDKVTVSTDVLA